MAGVVGRRQASKFDRDKRERAKVLIKVNAQNDTNGNPRRGWLHLQQDGRFLGFYPEGYDDGGETLRELRKAEGEAYPSINITPKEYKRLKGLVA
jgi:hypothetical protein